MTTFADLGLSPSLLKTLASEGYETPTPIQGQAIPLVLDGGDVLGIAQTGTGKTAAFALPILQRLAASQKTATRRCARVLVLAPTRELAQQIADSFRTYGKNQGVTVAVFVGGLKYGAQIKAITPGVDVLVATPGRLMDHMAQGTVKLDETEVLVLDEADQMLDLGFVEPIRKIVRKLPQRRQNLFFSATMPKTIQDLAGEILRDPREVSVTPQSTTVEKVNQVVMHVEADGKRDLLLELLSPRDVTRALVFTRTKRGADRVAKFLDAAGVESDAIHGDKSQGQRQKALDAFKKGRLKALIATDIAARGIDVDAVSHVFQYELPNVPESYVHRIGRTARAGAEGVAVTLCDHSERNLLRDIERLIKMSIPAEDRRKDQSRPLVAPKSETARAQDKFKKKRARGRGGDRPAFGQGEPRPMRAETATRADRPARETVPTRADNPRRDPAPARAEAPRGDYGRRDAAPRADARPARAPHRPDARPQVRKPAGGRSEWSPLDAGVRPPARTRAPR